MADKGIFNFNGLNVFTSPKSEAKVKLVVEGIETYGNLIDFVKFGSNITLDVRACI